MDEPELNPYAAPEAPLDLPTVAADGDLARAEATRREYLNHEASVKSVGTLHYLGAFFGAIGLLSSLAALRGANWPLNGRMLLLAQNIGLFGVMVGLNVALGIGLNGLRSWARWVETALVALSLAAQMALMGLGTFTMLRRGPGQLGSLFVFFVGYGIMAMIPGYILYLLLSRKGTVVFSTEYRAVIEQTPHVKYRLSCLVWFLLVLIGSFLVMALVSALFGVRR